MPKLRLTKKLCFNLTLLILAIMATVPVTGKTDERGEVPLVNSSRLPELLAPAGDWECARAAVENGADAIYFGLERFNARIRARNFTDADLLIEDVAEHDYKIDRTMFHLSGHPTVRIVRQVRLGRMSDIPDNDPPFGSGPDSLSLRATYRLRQTRTARTT